MNRARRRRCHPATSLTAASARLRRVNHRDKAGQNVQSEIPVAAPPPPPHLATVIDTNGKAGQWFFPASPRRDQPRECGMRRRRRGETNRQDAINQKNSLKFSPCQVNDTAWSSEQHLARLAPMFHDHFELAEDSARTETQTCG